MVAVEGGAMTAVTAAVTAMSSETAGMVRLSATSAVARESGIGATETETASVAGGHLPRAVVDPRRGGTEEISVIERRPWASTQIELGEDPATGRYPQALRLRTRLSALSPTEAGSVAAAVAAAGAADPTGTAAAGGPTTSTIETAATTAVALRRGGGHRATAMTATATDISMRIRGLAIPEMNAIFEIASRSAPSSTAAPYLTNPRLRLQRTCPHRHWLPRLLPLDRFQAGTPRRPTSSR